MDDMNQIKECTTASFRADVIAESAKQPVLVLFHAPSVPDCETMISNLGQACQRAAGKIKAVKLNIDEHPQIARQMGVQSVPAVFAFQKGQPADGFMGALPITQVVGFIERLVGPLGGAELELRARAQEALERDDLHAASGFFEEALAVNPDDVQSICGLMKTKIALKDLKAARGISDALSAAQANDPLVQAAKAALENAEQATSVGGVADLKSRILADPKDYSARLDLAIALNAVGEREEASEELLEIIKRDRDWNDGAARKQLLQFFEAWGHGDPDSMAARRKLSVVLFA
jgi:putative thioredoxin